MFALKGGQARPSCCDSRFGHAHGNPRFKRIEMNVPASFTNSDSTTHAAEQMANVRVDQVFVNMSCGTPRSTRVEVELSVSGHQIRDTDVRRVLDMLRKPIER